MKFLILGGTQMLGRGFVEILKEEYKDITLANRNLTNPFLFPDLKKITIDRDIPQTCLALKKESYDVTIDFSCYNLDQFKNTFENLNTKKYIYISTMGVLNLNEKNEYYDYSKNKLAVEEYIISNSIKGLIIRPCAVYGDNDYTNRFYKKDNIFFWKNTSEKAGEGCISVDFFANCLKKHLLSSLYKNDIQTINIF
jgi:nucleoside-diphosphate-sugar epimerase